MREERKNIIDFIIRYYKENRFYPNLTEISKGIGKAKKTTHHHMKKMEKEGIIIKKPNSRDNYRLINMDFICRSR